MRRKIGKEMEQENKRKRIETFTRLKRECCAVNDYNDDDEQMTVSDIVSMHTCA